MKSISGSVGVNGKNNSHDVMIVQYLLNCVPEVKGGPDAELAVDGMCGPLTCAAINKFQKKQMGWGDGRVDPNGKTIASLNNFDPYPAHNPFAGGGGTAGAKPGKGGGGSFGGGKQGSGGGGQEDYPAKFGKQPGFGGGGGGTGSKQTYGGPGGSPKQGGGGGQEDYPAKFGKQPGFGGGGGAGSGKQPGGYPGGDAFPSKFGGKQGW